MRSQNGKWPAIGCCSACRSRWSAAEPTDRQHRRASDQRRRVPTFRATLPVMAESSSPRFRWRGWRAPSHPRGMLRAAYGDGGQLVLLSKDGSTRVLTAGLRERRRPGSFFRRQENPLRRKENRGRSLEHLRNEGRRKRHSPDHARRGELPEPHVPVGPVLPQRRPAFLSGHFRQRCCRRTQRVWPSGGDESLFDAI